MSSSFCNSICNRLCKLRIRIFLAVECMKVHGSIRVSKDVFDACVMKFLSPKEQHSLCFTEKKRLHLLDRVRHRFLLLEAHCLANRFHQLNVRDETTYAKFEIFTQETDRLRSLVTITNSSPEKTD